MIGHGDKRLEATAHRGAGWIRHPNGALSLGGNVPFAWRVSFAGPSRRERYVTFQLDGDTFANNETAQYHATQRAAIQDAEDRAAAQANAAEVTRAANGYDEWICDDECAHLNFADRWPLQVGDIVNCESCGSAHTVTSIDDSAQYDTHGL